MCRVYNTFSGENMKNINQIPINQLVSIVGQITKKVETKGPTIFMINDGTQIVTAKLFNRKVPLAEGDYVTVSGNVTVYNGDKEIQISSIVKSDTAKGKMEQAIKDMASPKRTEFKTKAEYLDKLKDEFIKAATIIRAAVFSNRPILIRHHSDVDGFSGGLQIERAIQLIATDPKYRLRRSVMRAPFYEMEDIFRDIGMAEQDKERWNEQPPLVVILDNGSSTQDVDAIKLAKMHGMDFVVVDHHVFGESDQITPLVKAHINQLRVGDYETCTGFLAFELARMISENYEEFHDIPAFAGISDRVEDEVREFHLQNSKANRELLQDYEQVLTWALGIMPYMDNTAFLQKVFWATPEYMQALVNQFKPQLDEKKRIAVDVLNLAKDEQKVGDVDVTFVPVSVLPRRSYPKAGMATGLLFDKMQETNPKSMVIGVMDDGFILRIRPETGTDVHKLIKYLDSKLPYQVLGGGHAVAGSVRLSKGIQTEEELNEIKQLILEHIKEEN